MRTTRVGAVLVGLGALGLAACGGGEPAARTPAAGPVGPAVPVVDTVVAARVAVAGTAQPLARATLSTRLMAAVTAVLVQEGDRVAAGQVLVRLDQRDLDARRAQAEAGLATARAMQLDAERNAERFRRLHADSAAPRVALEQAEVGLVRATAALQQAEAARRELGAVEAYAEVRAPFAGTVVRRHVDPGAFAAPGSPLVEVQDLGTLRVTATVPPDAARRLRRGQALAVEIEGDSATGTVEGVVPAGAGSLYTLNVRVANPGGRLLGGGAATVHVPLGERRALLVPVAALVHEGDLTGVRVVGADGATLRWVRLGAVHGALVEVLAGVEAGERVLVPAQLGMR